MLTFKRHYFVATILLLCIEILIALFVHDRIVRPYIGDVLVVILIYCFVKSFLKISVFTAAMATLLFAYLVEIGQYFNMVTVLGLQDSKIARTVLGTSFGWVDLVAYTVGVALVLGIEKVFAQRTLLKGPTA